MPALTIGELESYYDDICAFKDKWRKAKAGAKAGGFPEVDKFFTEDLSKKLDALEKDFGAALKIARLPKPKRVDKDTDKAVKAAVDRIVAVNKVALNYQLVLGKISNVTTVKLRSAVAAGNVTAKEQIEAPARGALPAAAQPAAKARLDAVRPLSAVIAEILGVMKKVNSGLTDFFKGK